MASTKTTETSAAAPPPPPAAAPQFVSMAPAAVAEVLEKVDRQLRDDQIGSALQLLARAKISSPWLANARGVCLLRLGKHEEAIQVFRGLVLNAGGITLRKDVPGVFKANFALGLLASGNVAGCESALGDLDDEEHATVGVMKATLRAARQAGTLWQRVSWRLWGLPAERVKLEPPLGGL